MEEPLATGYRASQNSIESCNSEVPPNTGFIVVLPPLPHQAWSTQRSVMWSSRNNKKRKADTSFDIGDRHERARTIIDRLHLDTLSVSTLKGVRRQTDAFKGEKVPEKWTMPKEMEYSSLFRSQFEPEADLPFLDPGYFEHWDEEHETMKRSKARTAADNPMSEWLRNDRETFLQELLRTEGRGDYQKLCACGQETAVDYRCVDCFHSDLQCKECIVTDHKSLPLHRIERWNDTFFEKTTLKKLGLRIQLNHGWNDTCPAPHRANGDDFIIIDTLEIHEVGLDFCNCEKSKPWDVQLLRCRLYPTTGSRPSSADRYDEFARVVRQYRHLKMLKRSGRGHNKEGIASTKPGECALVCPACPQPGRNLPPNWKLVPEDKKYLYALFLALDANFKLKRKAVSSEERDPSLGQGWAFFVEETNYKTFLKEFWHEKQPKSNCVSHDAVNKPDREARGLAASGAGTVDCSRHDLKRACSVGDLQLGESILRHCMPMAPQYSDQDDEVSPSPPPIKFHLFHLPAHVEDCNLLYSFNLAKGAAQTDGEAPERGWANINPLSQSTKEMGPGNRRDTIDDFFNDWNWKKIIKFGSTMLKKIHDAANASKVHEQGLADLEDCIPPDVIEDWRTAVEAWEIDSTKTNPYRGTTKELSEREVRLKLAKEVSQEEEHGPVNVSHEMHPSTLIANGLALEEEQRKLSLDNGELSEHATATQLYRLTERSNQLRRKLTAWIECQVSIIPDAARERSRRANQKPEGTTDVKVENMKLWLPSDLAASGVIVSYDLRCYEWQLRYGQAHDALDEVRNGLRVQAYLYKHKDRYAIGVKANTRSNNAIAKATGMVTEAAKRYRVARVALATLADTGIEVPLDWESTIRILRDEDCRKLTEGLVGDSESRRTISWIWLQFPSAAEQAEDPRLNDGKIEWARARARSMRWSEEVELLQEEMRRIRQFLSWESDLWISRTTTASNEDPTVVEGMNAYAQSQGHLRRKLVERFEDMWREVPQILDFFQRKSLA
ncbi:hypothetical protein H0H93_011016 [Arthromyces matolae]|nr:hypothetical protein H0H93_011016 [Arthromyces matolae]